MKKTSTLALMAALAATSLGAQAQITVDGKVSAAEIGTGAGKYQSVSTYAGTHSQENRGLQALYVGTSATKLYIALVGSGEVGDKKYNAFVVYLNVPGKTGVPAGTKLAGGNAGDSPLKHTPTMDMETDYGFRATLAPNDDDNVYYSFVDYTMGNTAPVPDTYQGNSMKGGAPITGTAAAPSPFAGARYAYLKSDNVTSATTAGSGMEVELDLAAMGLATGQNVELMAAYVRDGGAFTSDVLPMVIGQTEDLGSSPNFSTLAGKQYATYQVGTGVLATRSEVARSLGFSVSPNPAAAAATVRYNVAQGKKDVSLAVYDAVGRQVRAFNGAQSGAQSYDLTNLTAGMYVVKLSVGGEFTSQKLVVQ